MNTLAGCAKTALLTPFQVVHLASLQPSWLPPSGKGWKVPGGSMNGHKCKTCNQKLGAIELLKRANHDLQVRMARLTKGFTDQSQQIAALKLLIPKAQAMTPAERERKQFYNSAAWARARYAAVKKSGGRCMACRRMHVTLHVDHVKPSSLFPALALSPENLQVLCALCNIGKGNHDMTDWRK